MIFSIWKQLFQWQQQQKIKSILGKRSKSLVLVPHWNENISRPQKLLWECTTDLWLPQLETSQPVGEAVGMQILCWSSHIVANPLKLGLWWRYHPNFCYSLLSNLACSEASGNEEELLDILPCFSSPVEICKGVHKNKSKGLLALGAPIWERCNTVVAWEMKYYHQIKPQSGFRI